jgi:CPA2 family monovalent cation:H+ antiporter-2
MPEHDNVSYLRDALILLLAAVVIVPVFRQLRINAVIGYLIAGGLIGPYGWALIEQVEGTHRLAELGVVFLLFAIGLELSFDRLRVMAKYVFGLGVLQVAFTGVAIGTVAWLLGTNVGQAAVIGGALALSSTAFVLQMLSQRGELHTRLGRVTLAVLLLQDLAVVPGLAVVTALGRDPDALAWSLLIAGTKALAALILLLLAGRLLLRPLYRAIAGARSPELFAAATLLVVLGTAWVTALAGLSMALGAFLAGLMLAGTEYRHQIEADIRPVRGILLGLFFISVGMLIDLRLLAGELPQMLLIVLGLVLVKAIILVVLCAGFRLPLPISVNAGLHLAQGGEFAFVLFSLAMSSAVLPVHQGQLLLGAVAVSMALTPVLAAAGRKAQAHLEQRGLGGTAWIAQEMQDVSRHVIIAGYGRVGRNLARLLDIYGERWAAIDFDSTNVERAHRNRRPVFFGDAGQEPVLRAAGAERARAVVVTLDDPAAAAKAVAALRRSFPDLPILVRARDARHMHELAAAGATEIMPEMTEASLLLGSTLLRTLGADDRAIDDIVSRLRRDAYAGVEESVITAQRGSTAPSEHPGQEVSRKVV